MLPAEQVAPAPDEKIPHPTDEAALASDEAQRFAVTEDSTKRALRVFHIYRMVVAGLLLLLYVADHETSLLDTLDNPLAFLQVVQVYAILVLMGYFVVHVSHMPLQPQIHSALLIDVVALTLIMHATGGVRIGLDVLLVPSIAAAGLLLRTRFALFYAAVGFFAITSSVLVKGFPTDSALLARSGVLGGICFASAIVANFLAERARRSEALARIRAQELEELNRLNETIVQRMQTGLIALDDDFRVRLLNNAARQSLSIDDDYKDRPLGSLNPALARHLERSLKTPDRPGGPAEEPDELPGLLVAFMRVGTAARRDTIVFIERQVDAEARLQQIKLAAVGRLTAGIAHEIRNPLAAVSNAAQLLEESASLDKSERRITEIIRNNARRMNRIVENILQVSRRQQARPRILQAEPFVRSLVDEFQSTRPEPFESLEFSVEPEDLVVYFDPGQLHQVVWNLCQNACRHGAGTEAQAVIDVRARYLDEDDSIPCLEVLDSGPGVTEEQQRKLFEPFFTTSAKGTGLGLYLSRELCEFNRAKLSYHLRPEGGSLFRITFSSKEASEKQWPIELH